MSLSRLRESLLSSKTLIAFFFLVTVAVILFLISAIVEVATGQRLPYGDFLEWLLRLYAILVGRNVIADAIPNAARKRLPTKGGIDDVSEALSTFQEAPSTSSSWGLSGSVSCCLC